MTPFYNRRKQTHKIIFPSSIWHRNKPKWIKGLHVKMKPPVYKEKYK